MPRRHLSLIVLLAVLAVSLGLTPAVADDEPTAKSNITVNPFLAAFGWYTGEFEYAVSPKFSVAISGSYVALGDEDIDEVKYTGVDIVPRLFPNENAPGGLFFGLRLGFRKTEESVRTDIFGDPVQIETFEQNYTAAGFEIGYTYLFGKNKNYVLSFGAGVVRLFGDELVDGSLTLPTIRVVNLGFAF